MYIRKSTKCLKKEIKETLNKWRGVSYLWIRRVNTVKKPVLPNRKS
jgi:hypothetical protein